jgi:hypothetical protein
VCGGISGIRSATEESEVGRGSTLSCQTLACILLQASHFWVIQPGYTQRRTATLTGLDQNRLWFNEKLTAFGDESHRLSLGGLLSSRARLRFAGCIQFAIKEHGRSRNFQRTANSVLTVCVSSGDKRTVFDLEVSGWCDETMMYLELFAPWVLTMWFERFENELCGPR